MEERMKSVFLFGDSADFRQMENYIKNEMEIECDWYTCGGRYIIEVPTENYFQVSREGKLYAIVKDLKSISWLNGFDALAPINATNIGYGILPYSYEDIGHQLSFEEYQPIVLKEYLKCLESDLKSEVRVEYHFSENALDIYTYSLDYKEQLELLKEFVYTYGYGPFEKIYPLIYDSKIINNENGEKVPLLTKIKS